MLRQHRSFEVVPVALQPGFDMILVNGTLTQLQRAPVHVVTAQFEVHADLLGVQVGDQHLDQLVAVLVDEVGAFGAQFGREVGAEVVECCADACLWMVF